MELGIYADFQVIDTPDFYIWYSAGMHAGTVWFDGPVPSWVPKYPGLDETIDWLYYQPNMFMITKGKIEAKNSKHIDIVYTPGQGVAVSRSKTRYKLMALEDGTSWFCVSPKKKIIYNRSVIMVNQGETYTDTSEKDMYYFVSSGKTTINGVEKSPLNYMKVLANTQVTIIGEEDSYLIKIWE